MLDEILIGVAAFTLCEADGDGLDQRRLSSPIWTMEDVNEGASEVEVGLCYRHEITKNKMID
jgi:hypothetical protein